MLSLLIALALIYAFLNGYRDSSSILAGVIASRAMHPRLALYLSALAEFAAPFLFGVAVARAVATGLVDPQAITLKTKVAFARLLHLRPGSLLKRVRIPAWLGGHPSCWVGPFIIYEIPNGD